MPDSNADALQGLSDSWRESLQAPPTVEPEVNSEPDESEPDEPVHTLEEKPRRRSPRAPVPDPE